ncbi:hypothetical protein LTR95_015583 [Oleoguttula sp. CCFEE 5521]
MATLDGTAEHSSSGAARLRELLADQQKVIVCPGVYDGLTARIAINAGFDCLYMTGAGTTASRLGMPDLGIATFNDMRDNAAMIAGLGSTPLIADADTGYGGPIMVGRTVQQYMRAGVAGLHLEDQIQSKRCGHLAGKELVDEETYLSRIKAAVMAREQSAGDIVIIARSDALQSLGYEAAVRRLQMAIQAGADVAFLEGFTTIEQGRQVCIDLAPTPVLLNMVSGGVTPQITALEAQEMGLRIVIHPGFALGPVLTSVTAAARELRKTGAINPGKDPMPPRALFEVCGLNHCIAFDKAAGGLAFQKGV